MGEGVHGVESCMVAIKEVVCSCVHALTSGSTYCKTRPIYLSHDESQMSLLKERWLGITFIDDRIALVEICKEL